MFMTLGLKSALLFTLTLSACSKSEPLRIANAAIFDAHPLWGGDNVFMSGDGSIWVQQIRPPKTPNTVVSERRYVGRLPVAEIQEFEDLIGQHNLLAIKIKERTGVPDEHRVGIVVKLTDGRKTSLFTWDSDLQQDFDPICGWLRARGRRVDSMTLAYEGLVDSSWKPPGF
jgi:hypothetical protein